MFIFDSRISTASPALVRFRAMPTRVYAPVSEGYTTSAIGREEIMSIQAPVSVPDFGAIKCPDCDTIMKPVTLSEEGELEQAAKLLECPKCGRRLTQASG